jgi:hypothetical protein
MKHETVVTVDDAKYRITHYPATKGTKLFARLTKLAAKPLAMMVQLESAQTPKGKEQKEDFEAKALGALMEALTDSLDEDSFDQMIKDVLSSTASVTDNIGVTEDFDVRFSGRHLHLFKLVGATVKFQYSDFFAGLSGALSKVSARMKSRNSPAHPKLTGESGES